MAALGYPPMVVSLTPNVVPFYVFATTAAALAYRVPLARPARSWRSQPRAWRHGSAHSGAPNYKQLRRVLVGLDQIACGLLFFFVAGAISLRKAGIWPRSLPKSLGWLFKR